MSVTTRARGNPPSRVDVFWRYYGPCFVPSFLLESSSVRFCWLRLSVPAAIARNGSEAPVTNRPKGLFPQALPPRRSSTKLGFGEFDGSSTKDWTAKRPTFGGSTPKFAKRAKRLGNVANANGTRAKRPIVGSFSKRIHAVRIDGPTCRNSIVGGKSFILCCRRRIEKRRRLSTVRKNPSGRPKNRV